MHLKQERRCVCCRQVKNQKEMIRIAKIEDNYSVDSNQKLGGRGAYICHDIKCYNKARKAKRFETSLEITIPEEIYDTLASQFEEGEENNG